MMRAWSVRDPWAAHVRGTMPLVLSLALVASLFVMLPASAHPNCEVTDDAELDEACEDLDKEGGDEGGELIELNDSDAVLSSGADAIFESTQNLHGVGFSERSVPLSGPGSSSLNSDLAFSGDHVIQGTYSGFRIIDVSEPGEPVELVDFEDCVSPTSGNGSQGDVIVYGDILVRSWDAPRSAAAPRDCGGLETPAGQEGVHVFDISDPTAPQVLTFVPLPCGSHTASGVPDPDNGRLLVYNSPSSSATACLGIDIVEVPLSDPAAASYLRQLPSGVPGSLPNLVAVDAPSAAAGTYQAQGAAFGPLPTASGMSGPIVLANDGTAAPTEGCAPFIAFPAGAIALVDRGTCGFTIKAANAQAAGATALIVANNSPAAPFNMGGSDPSVTIPAVMISQADGNTIKAGLPATGTVSTNPAPIPRPCHDTGVILGDVMMAACAGGNGLTAWSMDAADGGSLEEPALLYSRAFAGVSIGHSAAFTWDGEVIVFGHEPGGGSQAQCQATSTDVNRTLFFLDADTGDTLGTLLHPRPQTATENCTWHNYNVVPTDKSYTLVSGNYQSGVIVVDFSDPANAKTIAYADPKPLSDTSLAVGGDWSTYWYNGFIYESDIRRGLIIRKLSDPAVVGARQFDYLNPQTQETSFPKGRAFGRTGR